MCKIYMDLITFIPSVMMVILYAHTDIHTMKVMTSILFVQMMSYLTNV